jgi:hypothetical protein
MNVETELDRETVTVYVDGRRVGQLDREWYDDWAGRIDDDPEACLTSCLEGDVAALVDRGG